jgi:hypothetical protein
MRIGPGKIIIMFIQAVIGLHLLQAVPLGFRVIGETPVVAGFGSPGTGDNILRYSFG